MLSLFVNSIPRCFHASSQQRRQSHENYVPAVTEEAEVPTLRRKPKGKIPVFVFKRDFSFANKEEAEDCSICLEEFTEGERMAVLPRCKHMYHKECIAGWLARSTRCPLCRLRVVEHVTRKSSSTDDQNGDRNRRNTNTRSRNVRDMEAWSHLYALYY